jgi:hypothetical protein
VRVVASFALCLRGHVRWKLRTHTLVCVPRDCISLLKNLMRIDASTNCRYCQARLAGDGALVFMAAF